MSVQRDGQVASHSHFLGVGLFCAVLGIVARVTWFWSIRGESYLYAHVQDSALYHEMALNILRNGFPLPEAFSVAPMYGVFLAGMYRLFGLDPLAVYAFQVILSGFTILLTVRLGRSLFGGFGAWVGGLVAALYPVSIIYDVRLLSVGMSTFLTVAAAWAGHRAWCHAKGRNWLLAGAVLGLGALVRGNLLLVAPALIGIAFWRGRFKHAALCGLGFILSISPATVHNHSASGEVIPISLGGGINLYRGNNAYVVDTAVHPFRLPAQRDGLLKKSQLIASIETGKKLTPAESDRYWTVRSLLHWADSPSRAVGLTVRKLVQVLSPHEIGDHMDLDHVVRTSAVLKWIPPIYGPVVMLAFLGVLGTRRPRDAVPAAMLVVGLMSIAIFFVVSRYRTPWVPLLAIYAGGGMAWLKFAYLSRGRGRLWLGGLVMGAVGLSIFSPASHKWLPWNSLAGEAKVPDSCRIDQHVRHALEVEDQFNLGVFSLNHGRLADAEEAMWSVLKMDPTHTPAGVNLSWLLLQKGANDTAAKIAKKVIKVDECDDKAWANLATASMRLGDKSMAYRAAKKASEIDPYNPGYWSSLGESMMSRGNRDGAKALFSRAVKWRPNMWQAHARLGQMALEEGRYAEASTHLQIAVKAQPQRVELIGMLGLSEVGRGNREGASKLLKAAVKENLRGPALTALAKALARP